PPTLQPLFRRPGRARRVRRPCRQQVRALGPPAAERPPRAGPRRLGTAARGAAPTRRPAMIRAVFLYAAVLLGPATAAQAHQVNLSSARIAIGPDRTVTVEVAMKGSDVDRVAGTSVYDKSADRVRRAAFAASAAPILAYIRGHTAVLG